MKRGASVKTVTPNLIGQDMGEANTDNRRTIQIGKYKVNYVILLVHLNIFMYATCFWIQQGVFPYLSSKLGSGSVMYGYLQTTFAVVQLCGGPVFGRFGDLYGGRAALTLAFLSCALSYCIMGFANSIFWLFISRLPSIFMHAMQGGQMVVTDMASPEERAPALGRLGISYGIGMTVGPMIGGQLSKYYGEQNAAFVACFGTLLSAAICYTQIPARTKQSQENQTTTAAAREEKKTSEESFSIFNPKKYLSIIKHERAFTLLLVRFITGVPIGIFQSMFPIVAKDIYHLDAEHNGYIMSYVGILGMVVQGLGLGVLKKTFTEMQLIKVGTFVLIWAYLFLMVVTSVWQLMLAMLPLVFGLSVLTIVISAALTNSVDDEDTGAILGINMAVNSMIRAVSPTVGGYIFEWYGFPAFGVLGTIDSVLVTAFLMVKFRGE